MNADSCLYSDRQIMTTVIQRNGVREAAKVTKNLHLYVQKPLFSSVGEILRFAAFGGSL